MAARLLMVPIGDGSAEAIEVEVEPRDLRGVRLASARGVDGDATAEAPFTLAGSLGRVMPAISTIITRLRDAEHAPDEICMEMGLTVGGETGLIFTKGTAEATFTVTMTWRKPDAGRDQRDAGA